MIIIRLNVHLITRMCIYTYFISTIHIKHFLRNKGTLYLPSVPAYIIKLFSFTAQTLPVKQRYATKK